MSNKIKGDSRFDEIEKRISYVFDDKSLLETALTHTSYSKQEKKSKGKDNQRLEFLGDAVLELCVSRFLYREYPNKDEGWMTKARSLMVRENALFEVAKKIELGKYLLMSQAEEKSKGRQKSSILSDAVESLLAAIYIDGGFESANDFVVRFVPRVDRDDELRIKDPKTMLQEILQKDGRIDIKYKVIEEYGDAHDKIFVSRITINGKNYGKGKGKSKKEAEQEAALSTLSSMKY